MRSGDHNMSKTVSFQNDRPRFGGSRSTHDGITLGSTLLFLFCLIILAVLITPEARAVETAQTPPKGVRRFWIIGIASNNVDRRYDGSGKLENIVASNNQTLTMRDFERSEPRLKTLVRNLNELEPGLGDRLEANSNVFNDYTIRKDLFIPSFQLGLTDRLTVGLRTEVG